MMMAQAVPGLLSADARAVGAEGHTRHKAFMRLWRYSESESTL
jgi:hypothetical protein